MRRIVQVVAVLAALGLSACTEADPEGSFPAVDDTTTTTEDGAADETTASSTTTTTTTAPPSPERIELAADGERNTDPFELAGGRYVVEYSFGSDCYYSARLVRADRDDFGEDLATGTEAVDGSTNIYGVDAGSYYVKMNTGPVPRCPWQIVLTRQ